MAQFQRFGRHIGANGTPDSLADGMLSFETDQFTSYPLQLELDSVSEDHWSSWTDKIPTKLDNESAFEIVRQYRSRQKETKESDTELTGDDWERVDGATTFYDEQGNITETINS